MPEPIEPPEIPTPTPGTPTEPPVESPPGSPRPDVPPPMHEPGEPPPPDILPGKTPDEMPDPGPIKPTTPNPAVSGAAHAAIKENDFEGSQDQGGKQGDQAGKPQPAAHPKTTDRDGDVIISE